jgi:hypothetical protein
MSLSAVEAQALSDLICTRVLGWEQETLYDFCHKINPRAPDEVDDLGDEFMKTQTHWTHAGEYQQERATWDPATQIEAAMDVMELAGFKYCDFCDLGSRFSTTVITNGITGYGSGETRAEALCRAILAYCDALEIHNGRQRTSQPDQTAGADQGIARPSNPST